MLRLRSGGQTGADRAALDWALANGLPHEGWCPQGRRAEDGVIPQRYHLRETPSEAYEERTDWNVRDSDATVIFSVSDELAGGSRYAQECARSQCRPLLHLSSAMHSTAELASRLCAFLAEHRVRVLNLAGPRATDEPGVEALVDCVLSAALGSREVVRPALAPRAVAALVPLWGLEDAPTHGVLSLISGRNTLGRLQGKLPPYMANYVRVLTHDPFVSNYHASLVVVQAGAAAATPMVTIECTGSNGMSLVRRASPEEVVDLRRGPSVPQTVAEGDTLCLLPGKHPYRLLFVSAPPLAQAPTDPGRAGEQQNGHKRPRV